MYEVAVFIGEGVPGAGATGGECPVMGHTGVRSRQIVSLPAL